MTATLTRPMPVRTAAARTTGTRRAAGHVPQRAATGRAPARHIPARPAAGGQVGSAAFGPSP
jgi:hypothetical protein